MTKARIRIIAEGKTDQLVIEELAATYLVEHEALGVDIEFIAEQPTTDKTCGGGWEMVYKWCLSNSLQERESTYFGSGLFAGDLDAMACDALLIHMDSDVCERIGDKTTVAPVPDRSDSAAVRGAFIRKVLEEWLQLSESQQRNRHVVVPAVESVESWLVAGLSHEDVDPESNHSVQRRLAELDHLLVRGTPVPEDIKGPKKTPENYRKILAVAKKNTVRIANTCPHFKSMITDIGSAVTT